MVCVRVQQRHCSQSPAERRPFRRLRSLIFRESFLAAHTFQMGRKSTVFQKNFEDFLPDEFKKDSLHRVARVSLQFAEHLSVRKQIFKHV